MAFWSGHSHGRYASSAWYADTFWHDLHERCVCHVNIDSVGAKGAVDPERSAGDGRDLCLRRARCCKDDRSTSISTTGA